jgi:large subunit ribosomal protein L15
MAEQETAEKSSRGSSLSQLAPNPGARKRRKRLGIGEGSGTGKTCGRGQKGQKARSGSSIPAGFEGGQMPLHRRLPKIGFTSRKKIRGVNVFSLVKLSKLEDLNVSGEITLEVLRENGLIRSGDRKVKLLAGGEVKKKLIVEAHAASKSARAALEAAGGEVRIIRKN